MQYNAYPKQQPQRIANLAASNFDFDLKSINRSALAPFLFIQECTKPGLLVLRILYKQKLNFPRFTVLMKMQGSYNTRGSSYHKQWAGYPQLAPLLSLKTLRHPVGPPKISSQRHEQAKAPAANTSMNLQREAHPTRTVTLRWRLIGRTNVGKRQCQQRYWREKSFFTSHLNLGTHDA